MKLYCHPISNNARKPRAVARHLNLDIEEVVVNMMVREHRGEAFKAINPNGKIPALVDGDVTLFESNAICCYLASKLDNTLWPKSQLRYPIMQWMFWENAHLTPPCQTLAHEEMVKPMMGKVGNADKIAAALKDVARFAGVLNGQLEKGRYIVGETLTLADFAVGAPLAILPKSDKRLADFPAITKWLQALNEIPAWADTVPSLG